MAPDGDGNTPAEMARLEGHIELAAWLADRAAEANANKRLARLVRQRRNILFS